MPTWTTPVDLTTGHDITAAEWNAQLGAGGNQAFLYGDTAWIAVSAFTNAWVNFGAPQFAAAYRLVGNRVYLRGCIKTGTIGTTAFTLPAGYRPQATVGFACASNSAFGQARVGTTGAVVIDAGSNVQFFLDTIAFDILT
jgi:hypothetical protein